jgi:hypothetical protein
MPYHGLYETPFLWVFVIVWLLLKLLDSVATFAPNPGLIYPVARLVIILVGLILCLV